MNNTDQQPEANLPITHHSVDQDTEEFLQESEHSLNTILEVYRLQRQNPQHYLTICKSVQDSVNRAILTAICEEKQAEYEDIQRYTDKSKRTIRKRLNELEKEGIVERRNSRIVTVAFSNSDTSLLVKDALSMFYATI